MGQTIKLTASDGHELNAYTCEAVGRTKGCIVIVQEIFGINPHIRSVCDKYAELGYATIAPALFDRLKPGIELDYSPEDVKIGIEYKGKCADGPALADISAAVDYISKDGKVSVIGYCWGGKLTYLAACKISGISKAIGYYGGGIGTVIDQSPQIPTLLHYGDQDAAIPMTEVEAIIETHPELEVHVYSAGHGFNCDLRGSYDKDAADLALERTLKFIEGA